MGKKHKRKLDKNEKTAKKKKEGASLLTKDDVRIIRGKEAEKSDIQLKEKEKRKNQKKRKKKRRNFLQYNNGAYTDAH